MKRLRFAFVGCGRIAPFHADVVEHLGHCIRAVVARERSPNIEPFAERYNVTDSFSSLSIFVSHCKANAGYADCIMVCTPWDITEQVLFELLPLGIPVLAEKPAVLSVDALKRLEHIGGISNLLVAYNRRFYDYVPVLKEMINTQRLMAVDVLSAEPLRMIVANLGESIYNNMLYFYTSHIIDLLVYLFGDMTISSVTHIPYSEGGQSVISSFVAGEKKLPVQMKILMDCPQNSYVRLFFEKETVELLPLEKMAVYDRLIRKVVGGNAVYVPECKQEYITDQRFKPGFNAQMEFFIKNFVIKENNSAEYVEKLRTVTRICDALGSGAL